LQLEKRLEDHDFRKKLSRDILVLPIKKEVYEKV
jgi:hypothetical protein